MCIHTFFVACLMMLACGRKGVVTEPRPVNVEQEEILPKSQKPSSIQKKYPLVQEEDVVVAITDREQLASLEDSFGFASLLPNSAEIAHPEGRLSTRWLFQNHEGYQKIAAHLQERVDIISAEIQRDLIIELKDALQYPAGNVGRRLDNRWFESDIAFFQLIGIVNRLDKKDFYGGCGEVRFIYRMAYQTKTGASSRLPLTFNLVMENTESDCRQVALGWVREESDALLLARALNKEKMRFKQLEVNAQIVRFPSGLETEFAGQALYLLRVYGLEKSSLGQQLQEVLLENSPDVQRILHDESLKSSMIEWINAHMSDIDNGTHLLPEKFLATEALSYSTLGIHRRANKPFDVILRAELDRLDQIEGEFRWVQSKEALVDRLNNGTCVGCHQASTTAGFHFLGQDDHRISGVTNRLALPFSAHFHREGSRRKKQLYDLIRDNSEDTFRPHSLAPDTKVVPTNHSCILPEHEQDIQTDAQWTCAPHEHCEKVVGSNVGFSFGQCMPNEDSILAGNTCRTGTITDNQKESLGVFNLHAYADMFVQKQRYALKEDKTFAYDTYNCRPTRIGVPLGRAYRRCTPQERSFAPQQEDVQTSEICAVVGGAKFDSCVEKDFHKCLDSIVARGMVDSCHVDHFCREDYICQALPYQLKGVDTEKGKTIADAGVGFCTPTYFVFQLRLDGHPIP